MIKKTANQFKDALELSKGTHSLQEVFNRFSMTYDLSIDKLPKHSRFGNRHYDPLEEENWN